MASTVANTPKSVSGGYGFCFAFGSQARIFISYPIDHIYFNCKVNNVWQGWHKVATTYSAAGDGGYG